MENQEVLNLKVGGNTPPASLKLVIIKYLKDKGLEKIYLDTVGVAANYVATKAIIMARGQLSTMGLELKAVPIYYEAEIANPIDSVVKTGIRWLLNIEKQ